MAKTSKSTHPLSGLKRHPVKSLCEHRLAVYKAILESLHPETDFDHFVENAKVVSAYDIIRDRPQFFIMGAIAMINTALSEESKERIKPWITSFSVIADESKKGKEAIFLRLFVDKYFYLEIAATKALGSHFFIPDITVETNSYNPQTEKSFIEMEDIQNLALNMFSQFLINLIVYKDHSKEKAA